MSECKEDEEEKEVKKVRKKIEQNNTFCAIVKRVRLY